MASSYLEVSPGRKREAGLFTLKHKDSNFKKMRFKRDKLDFGNTPKSLDNNIDF